MPQQISGRLRIRMWCIRMLVWAAILGCCADERSLAIDRGVPTATPGAPDLPGTQDSSAQAPAAQDGPELTGDPSSPVQPSSTTLPELYLRLQQATVRIVSPQDRCSGVIVSADGLLLTVAHGVPGLDADRTPQVTVYTSDGRMHAAELLLRDRVADVALLRLIGQNRDEQGGAAPWPALPVFGGTLTTTGPIQVLAAGYPGREPHGLPPVVRIGEVLAHDERIIRSSCTVTLGDSGGPLMTTAGELIGLHQRIGLETANNHHIHAARILQATSKFNGAIQDRSGSRPAPLRVQLTPTPDLLKTLQQQTATVLSVESSDSQVLSEGTVLSSEYVATKLSRLQHQQIVRCRLSDGSLHRARLLISSRAMDLAILRLNDDTASSPDPERSIRAELAGVRLSEPELNLQPGTMVYAGGSSDQQRQGGILSRLAHDEPARKPVFGAALAVSNDQLRVQQVFSGGGAAVAGIHAGDQIVAAAHRPVTSFMAFEMLLKPLQPGDWIHCEVDRDGTHVQCPVELQFDPADQFEKYEFLDGRAGRLSSRRTGFDKMLQHDIPIDPEQCGGPLLDEQGRLIGINMARRSRECTLALPIDMVRAWISSPERDESAE